MAGLKPYTSNGTTSDPREQAMWSIYVTNRAKGVNNAYRAAIEAGYDKTTAKNITLTGWYKERLSNFRESKASSLAERNLVRILDLSITDEKGAIQPNALRAVLDITKFTLERTKREKYGNKIETKNTNLTFSLADLRKAREEREKQEARTLEN